MGNPLLPTHASTSLIHWKAGLPRLCKEDVVRVKTVEAFFCNSKRVDDWKHNLADNLEGCPLAPARVKWATLGRNTLGPFRERHPTVARRIAGTGGPCKCLPLGQTSICDSPWMIVHNLTEPPRVCLIQGARGLKKVVPPAVGQQFRIAARSEAVDDVRVSETSREQLPDRRRLFVITQIVFNSVGPDAWESASLSDPFQFVCCETYSYTFCSHYIEPLSQSNVAYIFTNQIADRHKGYTEASACSSMKPRFASTWNENREVDPKIRTAC